MKSSVIALSLLIAAAAHAAAPTVEEVGDADSFGRDVVYLGNAQTGNVALQADCTPDPMAPPPPPNDRCVVLNAQPATTTFVEDGLATMQLPADSTKSLICFALTPNVFFEFSNQTGVPQSNALYNARALITIENEVLDDPTLIDPATGLPYGGRMQLGLTYVLRVAQHRGRRARAEVDVPVAALHRRLGEQALAGRVGPVGGAGEAVLQEADDDHVRRPGLDADRRLRELLLRHPPVRRQQGQQVARHA